VLWGLREEEEYRYTLPSDPPTASKNWPDKATLFGLYGTDIEDVFLLSWKTCTSEAVATYCAPCPSTARADGKLPTGTLVDLRNSQKGSADRHPDLRICTIRGNLLDRIVHAS
jgi:hypothetical protein